MAIEAVSGSRISPTMTMSGSCRRMVRRPLAKVSPTRSLIWTWLTPAIWYSTGSSSVTTLMSGRITVARPAYSDEVLPDPVGPVISTSPCGSDSARSNASRSWSARPISAIVLAFSASLRGSRITTVSPCIVGIDETRVSASCRSRRMRPRPSCGLRRSEMSMPDRILMREISGPWIGLGTMVISRSSPSMRKRTWTSRSCGSMWMSEARLCRASPMIALTSRTTGASSTSPTCSRSSSLSSVASRSTSWRAPKVSATPPLAPAPP